jgi:copper homeostasis protein
LQKTSNMEICVDKIASAVAAADGGATRLELCSALSEGGLTPSIGVLKKVKKLVHIPVFCMVRCRPGNFTYSTAEIEAMQDDAKLLIENGADGIVFGALTKEGNVDVQACNSLIEVVPEDKPMTFHRAFDWTENSMEALEDIVRLKRFSRILTSGHVI